MGVFFLVLGLIDIPVIDQLVAEQVSASCAASALQLRHRNTRQPVCSLPACCCFASPVPLRPVSSCLIASPLVPTYHPHAVRPCRLRAAHCPLLRFLHLSLRRCPPPAPSAPVPLHPLKVATVPLFSWVTLFVSRKCVDAQHAYLNSPAHMPPSSGS